MTTESPPAAAAVTASGRRKLPMAVSLVAILVTLAAIFNLVAGAAVLVVLYLLAGQSLGKLIGAPFATIQVPAGKSSLALQPLDGFYLLAVGLIQLLLLFGFRRQRRWAWLGLMAWSGLQLAVVLYGHFAVPGEHLRDYLMMAIHSIVVLTLNAQEVQEAFGLRQPPGAGGPARSMPPMPESPNP